MKKRKIMMMEYEQVKKEEYSSSLHLPVKIGNEETTNNREREKAILSFSLSLCLSFINSDDKKKRKGKRRDSTDEQLVSR